jgi:RNA polymerase sigma-70 factor (ECF subfamily)
LASVDDAALIARARGGSTKAFESLVERHQRRVYALALRVLRDHDQADEATQRSFVHAWEHLGAFRGEASFATWLHHIAMNECRDLLRAERRKVALDDVPEARLASGGELQAPIGRHLGALVTELPPRQRNVLSLRVLGELPFADIARAEGISENAAKVNFHHAVRKLRAWLAGKTE